MYTYVHTLTLHEARPSWTALTRSSSTNMLVFMRPRPPRSTPASPVITATACCDTPSTKHSRHRPVRPIKEVPRDDEPDDENRGLPLAPAQGDERPRPPQHHRSGAPSGRSQREIGRAHV